MAVTLPTSVADAQEFVDMEMVSRIREEGLQRSEVEEVFGQFVTVFGPRLTASPAFNEVVIWARNRLSEWGMENSHLEEWEFGRGWVLEHFSIEMLNPRYMPLIAYPRADE